MRFQHETQSLATFNNLRETTHCHDIILKNNLKFNILRPKLNAMQRMALYAYYPPKSSSAKHIFDLMFVKNQLCFGGGSS